MWLKELADLVRGRAVGDVLDEYDGVGADARAERGQIDALRFEVRFCFVDDVRFGKSELDSGVVAFFRVENRGFVNVESIRYGRCDGIGLRAR